LLPVSQVTIMRALFALPLLLTAWLLTPWLLTPWAPAHAADPPKLAVFDFEMIDTSLEGEMHGKRRDEQQRLMGVGDQLRNELGGSGKFRIVDIAPVNAAAHQSNLQACGGCDAKLARELGAELYITGVVQKVSNLILNINVYLHDAQSGRLVTAASADMRGNTEESWTRATRYLVRERLLAPNYGAPQARWAFSRCACQRR
jgi:hypothetical protein